MNTKGCVQMVPNARVNNDKGRATAIRQEMASHTEWSQELERGYDHRMDPLSEANGVWTCR